MNTLTDPGDLKPSLGREGWCQRLLTELILDQPYPKWNTRLSPSAEGRRFLGELHAFCFGQDDISAGDPVFVDEIDLPARNDDEKGCSPDYTVFTAERCWVIELKTEPGSHRPRQISDYFERARHYHPNLKLDVTYLTAGLKVPFSPSVSPGDRYSSIEWSDIAEMIRRTWACSSIAQVRTIAETLVIGIENLSEPTVKWWTRFGKAAEASKVTAVREDETVEALEMAASGVERGLELAEHCLKDGKQRALGLRSGGLQALHDLRLELRDQLRASGDADLQRIKPWVWAGASSGGKPLTPEGKDTGFELRLSRYALR